METRAGGYPGTGYLGYINLFNCVSRDLGRSSRYDTVSKKTIKQRTSLDTRLIRFPEERAGSDLTEPKRITTTAFGLFEWGNNE